MVTKNLETCLGSEIEQILFINLSQKCNASKVQDAKVSFIFFYFPNMPDRNMG